MVRPNRVGRIDNCEEFADMIIGTIGADAVRNALDPTGMWKLRDLEA